MIKMLLPEEVHSVSFEGKEYFPTGKKQRIVTVPDEAEIAMYSFGLVMVGKNVLEPVDVPAEAMPEPPVADAASAQISEPDQNKK